MRLFSTLLSLVMATLPVIAQANIYEGTFANPPARSRPRFRYWLPDASVDAEVVRADVASAAAIGAGGLEFVPFFNYGGQMGSEPEGSDWSKYAFGSPAFKNLLISALSAHEQHGLFMDLALGPNQGQGVPANSKDTGLQWDLIPYTYAVNGTFDGKLPGWGEGELVASIAARVISSKTLNDTAQLGPSVQPYSWTQYKLDHRTLKDITSQTSNSTGHLSISFPDDGQYRLFSFYQRLAGHKNVVLKNERQDTIFDQGSYVVDHHSEQGAQTVIKFWEKYILDDQVKDLIKAAGNFAWEDSIEINSNITWSPSLTRRFEKRFGYSLKRYLPLIAFRNNNLALQPSAPGRFECILDTTDAGKGYEYDYRTILSEGYRDYLETLRGYFNDDLGIPLSVQPSYGLNQDMADSVPVVDVPECESLTFKDSIDGYRQFSGPAHLAGKNVISNEVGAQMTSAYMHSNKALLWSVNRGFSGGINQYVLHGQSFSGNYYETTWPGHTPFQYLFSELWSPKQPGWAHGMADVIGYIGRVQFILRQGVPRTDVAIYNKQSATDTDFAAIYPFKDLQARGWTYSYLSDSNLGLPQALVDNLRLAPDGPAWKAFVVEGSQNVTIDTLASLRDFARAGLPIIFVGIPGHYPTQSAASEEKFEKALSLVLEENNVHQVSPGRATQKLAQLGLRPQITTGRDSWYTIWREDVESQVEYAFLFNDGNASSTNVTFVTTKKPYLLNAWTGERSAILNYSREDGSIVMPVHLEKSQTAVIAFEPGTLSCSITSTTCTNILKIDEVSETEIAILTERSCSKYNATLSSGKKVAFDTPQASPSFTLSNWTLLVEHWGRPDDEFDAATVAKKFNMTHEITSLRSWVDEPSLVNVSGVGYYTSIFTWPPCGQGTASGAFLRFPEVLHGLNVYVNGEKTPVLDHRDPVVDITPYLRKGDNEVLAKVPSTMYNYLRTIWDELKSSGEPPKITAFMPDFLTTFGPVQNGLVGEVRVVPFVEHKVSC